MSAAASQKHVHTEKKLTSLEMFTTQAVVRRRRPAFPAYSNFPPLAPFRVGWKRMKTYSAAHLTSFGTINNQIALSYFCKLSRKSKQSVESTRLWQSRTRACARAEPLKALEITGFAGSMHVLRTAQHVHDGIQRSGSGMVLIRDIGKCVVL